MTDEEATKEAKAGCKIANHITDYAISNEKLLGYAEGNVLWLVRGLLVGVIHAIHIAYKNDKVKAFNFINQTMQDFYNVEEV